MAKQARLDKDELDDLKDEIEKLKDQINQGSQADESLMAKIFRNIKRMAPDILEVITKTALDPIGGLGLVDRKVAAKMASEAKG
jgi:hypothetical protein